MADIARKVGCTAATVSMALSGNLAISLTTREKIHAACKRMGYQPSPLLASLASRRFHATKSSSNVPLALIVLDPLALKKGLRLEVAMEQSSKLGYKLITYTVKDLSTVREPGLMLYNRGIQGIIFPSFVDPSLLPRMDWTLFSVVALGHPLEVDSVWATSGFHRVTKDYYEAVAGSWRRAVKAGYQRIGFVHNKHPTRLRDDDLRLAAGLCCQNQTPKSRRVPIFDKGLSFGEPCDLRPWLERYRPDIVIGTTARVWWDIREAGWRVPEDVGFINLHKGDPEHYAENNSLAGMVDPMGAEIEVALELLDREVRLRYRGITGQPQTILLHPKWVDAASMPLRLSAGAEACRVRK